MSVNDIARNLENSMGVSSRKAYQLAQNEGARVRKDATVDCIKEAKKKGADLVKMWDATMDSKTRPIHAELHGKWAEVDEKFEYSGGEVFAPKEFGVPALDINCRCALLSVPRWDVDDNARHYDNAWRENDNDKMYVDVKNYEQWRARYLTNVENEANNIRGISSRNMAMGLRNSPSNILDDMQIQSIKEDAISINIPTDVLDFNSGIRTGFVDGSNKINIKGDIIPDTNSNIARDRMTQRAVLAHEYYGHYQHDPSNFEIGDWRDEFQASYFASINAPNLTDEERRDLMIDAFDRAREANVPVRLNKIARKIIYGYEEE